jgi:hypothetical protein
MDCGHHRSSVRGITIRIRKVRCRICQVLGCGKVTSPKPDADGYDSPVDDGVVGCGIFNPPALVTRTLFSRLSREYI